MIITIGVGTGGEGLGGLWSPTFTDYVSSMANKAADAPTFQELPTPLIRTTSF